MTASASRKLTLWLWLGIALSLLAWMDAGYSRLLCILAVIPLLVPLPGLWRGQRYTYAWATLLAVAYLAFAVTELLVNPAARWAAGASLILVFLWFCSMILYLRTSRAPRG